MFLVVGFDLVSFLHEGRVTWRSWVEVVDPFGGWGHHELILGIAAVRADPALFVNDLYRSALDHYFLPFVEAIVFLHQQFGMDVNTILLLGEHLSRLALGAGIYAVSLSLFGDWRAGALTLLLLVRRKATLGFIPTFSAWDFNADLAVALGLFSLSAFVRGRYGTMLLINSAGFLFHYGYPSYLALFYTGYLLAHARDFGTRKLLFMGVLGAVPVLPFALWIRPALFSSLGEGYDETLWLRMVMTEIGYHFFLSITSSDDPYFWPNFAAISAAGGVALAVGRPVVGARRKIYWLTGAVATMAIVHVIFSDIMPSPQVIRVLMSRSTLFLLLVVFIYFGRILVDAMDRALVTRRLPYLAVTVGCCVGLYLMPLKSALVPFLVATALILVAGVRWRKGEDGPSRVAVSGVPGFLRWALAGSLVGVIGLAGAGVASLYYPSLLVKEARAADWRAVQLWARTNTPPTALFVKPPADHGFRTLSQRSSFIDPTDAVAIALLDASKTRAVFDRVEALNLTWPPTKEAVKAFYATGEYLRINERYGRLTAKDFRFLQKKYGITHVVTEARHVLEFPVAFASNSYRVYVVP